jgi:hypothetical protein
LLCPNGARFATSGLDIFASLTRDAAATLAATAGVAAAAAATLTVFRKSRLVERYDIASTSFYKANNIFGNDQA